MPPHKLRAVEGARMSTCAGPASPEQRRPKICEACGQEFLCSAMAPGCWCEEIHLTAAAREEIARRYRECLCRNCLAHFAADERIANPEGTRSHEWNIELPA